MIPSAIAQALGYVEKSDLPAEKRLIEGIGNKRMLLVLDNCEHLIEDVAPLASSLLSACSRLKILTTSREALRIPGEWLYSVPALDMPKEYSIVDVETVSEFPAMVLFAERARAARSDFALNAENIRAVASICSQLDGLPLAIELIAARVKTLSIEQIAPRLDHRFTLLTGGSRIAPSRQQTLRATLDWSYELLTETERELFRQLSVFVGGFTLDALEISGAFGFKSIESFMRFHALWTNHWLLSNSAIMFGISCLRQFASMPEKNFKSLVMPGGLTIVILHIS